jgi:hypothetical protein
MPEKLVIRTHGGVDAYAFRDCMHNIDRPCRVDVECADDDVKYVIYM